MICIIMKKTARHDGRKFKEKILKSQVSKLVYHGHTSFMREEEDDDIVPVIDVAKCLLYQHTYCSTNYRIYANIPHIFFPEFSEEKLWCALFETRLVLLRLQTK